MSCTAHPSQPPNARPAPAPIFASLELSRSRWLVTVIAPDSDKMSKYSVQGGDGGALLGLLARLRARAERRVGSPVGIVTIQEAGFDGFWIHRRAPAAPPRQDRRD